MFSYRLSAADVYIPMAPRPMKPHDASLEGEDEKYLVCLKEAVMPRRTAEASCNPLIFVVPA